MHKVFFDLKCKRDFMQQSKKKCCLGNVRSKDCTAVQEEKVNEENQWVVLFSNPCIVSQQ